MSSVLRYLYTFAEAILLLVSLLGVVFVGADVYFRIKEYRFHVSHEAYMELHKSKLLDIARNGDFEKYATDPDVSILRMGGVPRVAMVVHISTTRPLLHVHIAYAFDNGSYRYYRRIRRKEYSPYLAIPDWQSRITYFLGVADDATHIRCSRGLFCKSGAGDRLPGFTEWQQEEYPRRRERLDEVMQSAGFEIIEALP